jgi:hypothetical protein
VVHGEACRQPPVPQMRRQRQYGRPVGPPDDSPERPDPADAIVLDCPRCGRTVEQPFYGPCAGCCAELRALHRGEAVAVEVAEYEPKMNVTPNAVALKDS